MHQPAGPVLVASVVAPPSNAGPLLHIRPVWCAFPRVATGARIGEVLALRWSDIDLDAPRPNLTIDGTIKTEPGKGTYRKATPKSAAGVRTVVLPDFAVEALCRRRKSIRANPSDAVFPTRNGTWQQVNNVEGRWRQIRLDTGLDWVTPHVSEDRGDPDR